MRWFIFCQWEILPEDAGVSYEQKIEMNGKDGVSLIDVEQPLIPEEGKTHHRAIAAARTFPIVDAGTYRITASLRKHGDTEWIEQGSYPLLVFHTPSDQMGALI